MKLHIRQDDLTDPRIAAFLEEHMADMRRVSPPESVHALDLQALRRPEIRFWSAWMSPQVGHEPIEPDAPGAVLAGTAALKRLDARHAELKSMRTAGALRGQGIARQLLEHAVAHARAHGFEQLSLETGSQAFFEPARQLYARHGFMDCGPFGDYGEDPHSCFMTRLL